MRVQRLKFVSPVKSPGGKELLTSYDVDRHKDISVEMLAPLVARLSKTADGRKHSVDAKVEYVEYAPEEPKK